MILKCEDIKLSFGGVRALSGVFLEVKKGEILGIIGPNGSGKTSLFNVITGIYKPDSGKVFFERDGNLIDITGLPPHKIARLGISRTFQNIRLFGYLTVLDNILIGRNIYFKAGVFSVIAGIYRKDYEKNREIAEEMIDFLDLKPYRYFFARDIPLGVRKKVELARALVQMPKVLLLDEPTSGLTYEEKSEFLYYVKEINEKFGITLVVIEHDVKVISSIANRVVALDFGIKVAEGSSQEVLNHPRVIESYLGSL